MTDKDNGTIFSSDTPSGDVQVGETTQPGGFYGSVTRRGAVERVKLFFKQSHGIVTAQPSDPPGKLLAVIDLDFHHGTLLAKRKTNYAKGSYLQVKIQGKRVDIAFGRSGAIAVVFTTNPWYKYSTVNAAANLAAARSDPNYKLYVINESIDIDLGRDFAEAVLPQHDFFFNASRDMPANYHTAGRVYILLETAPTLMPYSIPMYVEGTINATGYIPTELSTIEFSKTKIEGAPTSDGVFSYTPADGWVYSFHVKVPTIGGHAYGVFVTESAIDGTVVVKETPADDGEEDDYEEIVHVFEAPVTAYYSHSSVSLAFRTSLPYDSGFINPMVVSTSISNVKGYGVFESLVPEKQVEYQGVRFDDMRESIPLVSKSELIRVAGSHIVMNLDRVNRGLQAKPSKARPVTSTDGITALLQRI